MLYVKCINPTSYSRHMSCHGYEGVMSVLCTPLQVKCYPKEKRSEEYHWKKKGYDQARALEQEIGFAMFYRTKICCCCTVLSVIVCLELV